MGSDGFGVLCPRCAPQKIFLEAASGYPNHMTCEGCKRHFVLEIQVKEVSVVRSGVEGDYDRIELPTGVGKILGVRSNG